MAPLRVPLVTNVDASIITSGDEARDALVRQVTLPVRWEDSMRELIEEGTSTFVEVGPGRVLSGVLRQIERSVHCFNVEDSKSLQSALERLAQAEGEAAEASLDCGHGPLIMFSLKDRVALVTGASQGIGRATALALAAAGARVVAAARNARKSCRRRAGDRAAGGEALAVQMDVADAEQIKAGFRQGLERFRPPGHSGEQCRHHARRLGGAHEGRRLGRRACARISPARTSASSRRSP